MSFLNKLRNKIAINENLEPYTKLVFAIEPHDSLTGTSYINGTSRSYYVKELGKLSQPLTINSNDWYQSVRNNSIPHHRFRSRGNLLGTYKEYNQILDNEHYIYYIYLENVYFFKENKEVGFRVLDNKVIDDCRNNKCLIVLSMPFEGTSGIPHHPDDFTILDSWVKEFNLPKNNVLYLTANQKCQQHCESLSFQAVPICCQEIWNDPLVYDDNPLTFKPQLEKSLYLNFNRAFRFHRKILLAYLYKENLLHLGMNSWAASGSVLGEISQFDPDLLNAQKFIEVNHTQHIDQDIKQNLAMNISLDCYEKTFISLVTETLHFNESLFFSEKIWKPIMVGHPFMILGSPGSLAELKSRGYRTFDKWLDESYDNIPDLKQRISIITANLKKLAGLDIQTLMQLRLEMNEICVHNKMNLKREVREKYYVEDIYVPEKNILDVLVNAVANLKESS